MLTGVVFCGGKSSRMGSDKGLLQKGLTTWAELAFQKLQCLGLKVVISINETQKETYSRVFTEELLVVDRPSSVFNCEGPLRGLLSVHQQLPESELFVLACDMTDISIAVLYKLKNIYRLNQFTHDNFTYINQGESEPMCAIYSWQKLHEINRSALDHQLVRFSLKYILSKGKTLIVKAEISESASFFNYNEKLTLHH
ncbi:MAG: NTP transferase domain-containing protein [Bacteroidota bacterium]|nr:NTP transferase domain-containing protein [Bacteroidota bacterium]